MYLRMYHLLYALVSEFTAEKPPVIIVCSNTSTRSFNQMIYFWHGYIGDTTHNENAS